MKRAHIPLAALPPPCFYTPSASYNGSESLRDIPEPFKFWEGCSGLLVLNYNCMH